MSDTLKGVKLVPSFFDNGIDCYHLEGRNFINRYYVVSDEGTRKLLNTPEVVGYDVYHCLLRSTSRMMKHFRRAGCISSANILSILRGALNYPLEESCYNEGIRVHDISFLSSERVFHNSEIAGLEIKYSKLALVPDSTLLIGDIIATGDTLVHCLRYLTDHYQSHSCRLRNIIFFTIGGSTGIEVMERLTTEIRQFWPEFEGFIVVYYEGIFSTYQNKGISGINVADVDFYWKDAVIAPAYRRQTLSDTNTLFEKCTIYDGGARRYEIADHVDEVLEYWEGILERADQIDFKALTAEKLGYETPVSLEDWKLINHYEALDDSLCTELYEQELDFLKKLENVTLKQIAMQRIMEIKTRLAKYRIDQY